MLQVILTGLGTLVAATIVLLLGGVHLQRQRRKQGLPNARVFRPIAGITYNLTAERKVVGATMLARGERYTWHDHLITEEGRSDPLATLLAMRTASSDDVELRIVRDGIQLTGDGDRVRLPREALRSVYCASAIRGRSSANSAASTLHVCLDIDGIGQLIVANVAYTQTWAGWFGGKNPRPYGDAVEEAEAIAHSLAEALDVPCEDNLYRGLFSPLAAYLH